MRTTLRALIIEDAEDDALLLVRALRKGPWTVVHERVDTAAALSAALGRGGWDLILCDYTLPQFDGSAALAVSRVLGSDVPFILVSGTIGEATAADAMRAGASDFLIKGHLERLVPAVQRELAKADDRRAAISTEYRLVVAEVRSQQLFDESRDGIVLLDADTATVVDVNAAMAAMLGYDREFFLGKQLWEVGIFPDPRSCKAALTTLHMLGRIRFEDMPLEHRDGHTVPAEFTSHVYHDGLRDLVQCSLRVVDCPSDADALRMGDERFRMMVQGVADHGIVLVDPNGDVLSWNAGAERITGYTAAEIIDRNISQLFPVADVAAGKPGAELVRAAKLGRCELEGWRTRADGTQFWASVLTTALRDPAGNLRGFCKLIRDIDEQRRIDEACRKSEGLLRAIVETAVDGIITIDEQGNIATFNPAAERLFGYAPHEVVGTNVDRLLSAPYQAEHDSYLQSDAASGIKKIIGIGQEVAGLRKDGSTFPMELAVSETVLGDVRIYTGIVRDITARRAADAEVRLLGQAMEDAVEGIARLDAAGRYVSVNAAYATMTGRTSAEMVGLAGDVTVHPDDLVTIRAAARTMVQTGRAEADVRGLNKAGAVFHKHVTLVAIRGKDGGLEGAFHFTKDVTDRKRADAELRSSQQLLASVLNGSQDGVLALAAVRDPADPAKIADFEFRLVNPAAERMVSRREADLIGKRLLAEFPGTGMTGIFNRYADVVTSRQPFSGELRYEFEGMATWFDIVAVPLGDGCAVTFGDISDVKRAAEELRRSQALLAGVLNASQDGVLALEAVRDPVVGGPIVDFVFRLANPAAEQLMGRQAADVLGKRLLAEFPGNGVTGIFDRYAAVAETGQTYAGEQRYDFDGLATWFHIVAVRLGDGCAVTFADVSEKKRAEAETVRYTTELELARDGNERQARELEIRGEELDVARRAAEAANRAKSEFLANMSHEIRTPMAAILGYADLMLDTTRSPRTRQADIQSIRRNGQHLLQVINDVLDLSKIEAGGMSVERISADLPRLAAEAVSMTRPSAIEKGLTLSLDFATPVPRTGLTDPLRLRQVLINLIGNAVKFTPAGSVRLRMTCDGPSDGDATVRFEVVDSGVGMTEAEQARLFQPFAQADVSTTRRFGGTGLGLTISRQFARLLGGDLTAASRPGQGSTFTATVRVGPVAADALVHGLTESGIAPSASLAADGVTHGPTSDALDGVRVLLAEDGLDNREILTAYLRGAGATVETTEDGQSAVDMSMAAAASGRPYAAVLMDMQMPVLDGYGATSELRRQGYAGPIIALTAHAMADDRAKCLAAGCDDYLTKPVDRSVLLAGIIRHTAGLNAGSGRSPGPLAAPRAVATVSAEPAPGVPIRSALARDPRLAAVVAGFVARLPSAVVELRRLRDGGAAAADLARAAHRLRGAGGSYGFDEVSRAASRVEDPLLAGRPIEAVAAELDGLIAVLRHIDGYDPAAEHAAAPQPALAA